jgi:hypothetical protein
LLLRSSDRGQTWTPPIRIATQQPVAVTDPDTGKPVVTASPLDDVAGDPRNGNLYAVWEDGRFNGRQHQAVAFSMSTDGGLTWSEPIQINQTPTDIAPGNQQAFLPTIQVAMDGTVGVTYYDFRFNDPLPGLPTDYWFVHAHPADPGSLANPSNWAHELRLTNSSFNMERAPKLTRGLFVGDYEGLAVAGNKFLAFWAQPGETDPANIFFRRIKQGDDNQPMSPHKIGATSETSTVLAGPTALRSGETWFDPASVSVALSASGPVSPLSIAQGAGPSLPPWRDPVGVLLPAVAPDEWRPELPHVAGPPAHATTRAVLDSFFADFGDNLEADAF